MTTGITIAPHHNKGFVIIHRDVADPSDNPLRFSFYCFPARDTNRITNYDGYYIGCMVGDPYNDDKFKRKLECFRAILHLKGLHFREHVGRDNIKEYRKMSNEQKYRRKLTKVTNEYERRKKIASASLFNEQALLELQEDYKRTIEVLRERYGVAG